MLKGKDLEKEFYQDESIKEKTLRFEKEFAKISGKKHAILFGSGNHALDCGLKYSGIEKGKEVLSQAFTCKQVSQIIGKNFKNKFVDIGPDYNINLGKAKKIAGKNTIALQAIYMYGKAIESKALKDFCGDKNLYLIEDCAHSLGAKNGMKAGSVGDFSIFSLRKNTPVGNGGVLCTNDSDLDYKCRSERDIQKRRGGLGRKAMEKTALFSRKRIPSADFPYIFWSKFGYGGKEFNKELLDRFEISLAIHSINILPKIVEKTISNAKLLMKELGKEDFIFPEDSKNEKNVYTRVPVYYKNPTAKIEDIWWQLQEEGFETGLCYTSDFKINRRKSKDKFPFSKKVSEHMIPIGVQGLEKTQIKELAERIGTFSK